MIRFWIQDDFSAGEQLKSSPSNPFKPPLLRGGLLKAPPLTISKDLDRVDVPTGADIVRVIREVCRGWFGKNYG